MQVEPVWDLTPPDSAQWEILKDKHHLFMEALRKREDEVLRFLAILGPALGGFIYLMKFAVTRHSGMFFYGTIGVQVILSLGAIYALALGFNFRYVVFQLAKIECALEVDEYSLKKWPRTLFSFQKYTQNFDLPEIIKVFWYGYVALIILVTITSAIILAGSAEGYVVIATGLLSVFGAICPRECFRSKFAGIYEVEAGQQLAGQA